MRRCAAVRGAMISSRTLLARVFFASLSRQNGAGGYEAYKKGAKVRARSKLNGCVRARVAQFECNRMRKARKRAIQK